MTLLVMMAIIIIRKDSNFDYLMVIVDLSHSHEMFITYHIVRNVEFSRVNCEIWLHVWHSNEVLHRLS